MKRFLIIGGAGFIGSHLADYLLSLNHEVMIFDNFSTGRVRNIKHIQEKAEFTDNLEYGVQECDIIYHLAASVGVQYVDKNPKDAMINNLDMQRKVFDLAEKYDKLVVYTSSSEVYGDKMREMEESMPLSIDIPSKLRFGYACSKLMGEFLALSYDFPAIIVRPFNIVGPRQVKDYGMVIPTFIKSAKMGEPIVVYGDGTQYRCFCSVHDAVRALYKLTEDEKCYNEVFNIGNPWLITIYDLALMIKEKCESSSLVFLQPYNEHFSKNSVDVYGRKPSIDKIIRFTGWTPKWNLDMILDELI